MSSTEINAVLDQIEGTNWFLNTAHSGKFIYDNQFKRLRNAANKLTSTEDVYDLEEELAKLTLLTKERAHLKVAIEALTRHLAIAPKSGKANINETLQHFKGLQAKNTKALGLYAAAQLDRSGTGEGSELSSDGENAATPV